MQIMNTEQFNYNGYVCRTLHDGTIRIESYVDPYADIHLTDGLTLIIPDTIECHPIHEIGDNAFAGNQSIKRVILPLFLTSIGAGAFADCPYLSEVYLPCTTDISEDAFIGSTRLRNLTDFDGRRISIDTIRRNKTHAVSESTVPTDYVYSRKWGPGQVNKRESDDIIYITFSNGFKCCLSYSHFYNRGDIVYIEKPMDMVKVSTERPNPINIPDKAPVFFGKKDAEESIAVPRLPSDNDKQNKPSGTADLPYLTEEGFQLSDQQTEVFRIIENNDDNYLITGKAGTGKSVLLRYFVKHTRKKVAVVAFTGVAALNACGQTIHSLFQFDTKIQDPKDRKSVENLTEAKKEVLRHLDALVIDEISMVRSDMMDMIDRKLRYAKKQPDLPFGGCQIIAFGDLFQLPPFFSRDEHGSRYLSDTYQTLYFFGAPCIVEHPLQYIELTEVKRQSNPKFIDALNAVRVGELTSSTLETINTRVVQVPTGIQCITLTPWNDTANEINRLELKRLPGDERCYHAEYSGNFVSDAQGGNETNLPADILLTLKVGAMVMMVRNDFNHKWVNGTLAVVTSLSDDNIEVEIKGVRYRIEKETWIKYEYKYDSETKELESKETGSFTQYPIRLAYAVTINKSQGQTYDHVLIDYAGKHAFAEGQTYVALSRCRSLEGIYLTQPLTERDIQVSREVQRYIRSRTPYVSL